MKIYILSAEQANVFEPKIPTVAMRIYSGICADNTDYAPSLPTSYVGQFKYVFDDVYPSDWAELHNQVSYTGLALFNGDIADAILSDFQSRKDNAQGLMVSCRYGQGRSAGVAIALNQIFRLGEDTERLFREYPHANRFVYRTLLERSWQ